MNHFKHRLCNTALGPAPGDEDVVDTLHVQRGRMPDGVVVVRSFWQPSKEDLEVLNAGGCVMMSVLSTTHPPVRIDTMVN